MIAEALAFMCILASIVAFALVLFTAIAIKRARPYGIVVALAQPVGLYAAMKIVQQYAQIDFSCLAITKYSSISLDDAMNKLNEAIAQAFTEQILPKMIGMAPWLLITGIVFIMTLVYAILLFKAKGKGLAIAAMVLTIIRFLLFSPVEQVSLLLEHGSAQIQTAWDLVYRLIFMLPLLLLAIQGIINLVANAKAKKAAAKAPAQEPAQEPAAE